MKEWHIPQNKVYSLSRRNGCLPCIGFRDWEKVMSAANPKLYEFILQRLGATKDGGVMVANPSWD
jgi:hypothetical protein